MAQSALEQIAHGEAEWAKKKASLKAQALGEIDEKIDGLKRQINALQHERGKLEGDGRPRKRKKSSYKMTDAHKAKLLAARRAKKKAG